MEPDTVATFFALLLLAGSVGVAAAWVAEPVRRYLAPSSLSLAAVVAAGAMGGSLWFSERAGYVPCELCWYQRAAMYPLAIALVVAAARGVDRIRLPAAGVAGVGLTIALYHVQLQWFPDQGSFCDATNPCTGRWVEAFGWMTIPQMAAVSFALVVGLLTLPPIPQESS